jgi:2-hydroxy-3-keto-5-methylthiopentenyl-1-phosphate phosphatase
VNAQLKRTAIVYDFDGTLSPGSMQQHSFIPELGYDRHEDFWTEAKKMCREWDGDEILAYMLLMVQRSEKPLTRAVLQEHGAQLPLFHGLRDWFHRLNSYSLLQTLALEHYVVSSGIREMIENCQIHHEFKRIFASRFAYDAKGCAIWPSVVINYTTKTQYLFRINKGIENAWDNEAINRWVPMNERPIPFERMIFIGDGDTDIPAMKLTCHHLADSRQRKRVDAIFAEEMMAASGDLLGKNRTAHEENRHRMGPSAGGDEGQQHVRNCPSVRRRRRWPSAASAWCLPWSRPWRRAPKIPNFPSEKKSGERRSHRAAHDE